MDDRVSGRADAPDGTAVRWPETRMRLRWVRRAVPPAGAPGVEFDALARDLAEGVSRRQILRRLLGAAAAALAAELFGRLALAPAPAAAASGAAPSPCSSSKTLPCLEQAQDALAGELAGCYPESVDQGSLSYWLADDRCLAEAAQGYQRDRSQCLGPLAGCPAGSECSSDLCCPAGTMGCGTLCCGAGQSCTNGQCSRGGPSCAAGQTLCSSACVDLQSDPLNCGGCGKACATGQSCTSGQCATGCAAGLTLCGSTCVNLRSDAQNCGACGQRCSGGQGCAGGRCACPAARPDLCEGVCTDTGSDPNNCGGCGRACGANTRCHQGACVLACPNPLTACNGSCVSLQTDPSNCGVCGRACGGGQICGGGSCGCPAGQRACNSGCKDVQTDPHNCGKCENECPASFPTCCNGACVNLQLDKFDCGVCGHWCPDPACCRSGQCVTSPNEACCGTVHYTGCSGSTGTCCGSGSCFSPFVCLNGTCVCPADRPTLCDPDTCERSCVNLQSDSHNCGACGHVCPPGMTCCSGACVNLQTDPANCGVCAKICAGRGCVSGKC